MRATRLFRRATARRLSLSAATAVATLTLAVEAQAQPGGVGPSCEVDANSPKELFVANQSYTKAAQAQGDPAARQAALKTVMKQLTDKADKWKGKNELGYQMLLGQSLAL